MTAVRRLHVEHYDHQSTDECYSVSVTRGGAPLKGIKPNRITYIEEELMYWRKANHIHAWFVDNVQDGNDDCKSYYVSPDDLRALLGLCERVIAASKIVDGTVDNGTRYSKEHPDGIAQRTAGRVIEDPTVAKELLPTCAGFFFGSEEYDESYLTDVVATRKWLVRTLAGLDDGVPGDIIYSSSW